MKQDITTIDKNFLTGSKCPNDLAWRNILNDPFEISGLAVTEGENFFRMPLDIAERVSEGVRLLVTHTAGGRVRFATDSTRIAVRCESLYSGVMSHMPLTGSAGCDIYVNGSFLYSVRPKTGEGGAFEGCFNNKPGMTEIEINLPLYNGIKRMLIGLDEGCTLTAPRAYKIKKPVVYYGSSITQGGCASRPGNSYQGFVSRWLDSDHINLGFSGNAKGESVMAEYIAGLSMSAFVLDYDHNASLELLRENHESFFKTIREKHPKLPVLMISRPDLGRDPYDAERLETVRRTYLNAKESGDDMVWFLDGGTLFTDDCRDACTVDGSHPNDLGFFRMAKGIYEVLREMEPFFEQ